MHFFSDTLGSHEEENAIKVPEYEFASLGDGVVSEKLAAPINKGFIALLAFGAPGESDL
jgi:hypothetical protein